MYEAFIDLDELIIKCRDKQSKQLIQEAVACYRVGAFRSCIVATWNAVVFDFLYKLKELALFGNGQATNLLNDFEKISSEEKFKELWQFESNIPNLAFNNFELISSVERSDIERLHQDRSRCAHPSMTSLEEPFEATAELARYHLRSAVTHLLQRPPVQGRSAKERIFQDIKSEYFPSNIERAVEYFKKGPLARSRFNLIQDIVLGLTISLLTQNSLDDERLRLTENSLDDERSRQFSALNAIGKLYPQQTKEILNRKLSDIILNKVTDENWHNVIVYLSSVDTWDFINEACQLKAKIFIEKSDILGINNQSKYFVSETITLMEKAYHIGFLKELVAGKFQIDYKLLLSIRKNCKDKYFIENVIERNLENYLSGMTLSELIDIKKDSSASFCKLMQPYVLKRIEAASLIELSEQILESSSNLPLDIALIDNIELILKKKLKTSTLNVALETYYNCNSIDEPNPELELLFQKRIEQLVETTSFSDFLKQSKYWDLVPEHIKKNVLKENVATIIDLFVQSNNYFNANENASLILEVIEFIDSTQWECILNAFCNNDQIYDSCGHIFVEIFQRSLNLHDSIPFYWVSFRNKLENVSSSKRLDKLKRLIDSSQRF